VRTGQRLQVPFEKPVRARGDGFLDPSIDVLKEYLARKENLSGSLFGKLGDYEWGETENFTIDDLVASLQQHVEDET
jgi:CRISPR system Cascade subunit CasC